MSTSGFLDEFDDSGGKRPPKPPHPVRQDTLPLDEDDDEWHEGWVDVTRQLVDNYDNVPPSSHKRLQFDCECGETVRMWPKRRGKRCKNCERVVINRLWDDDRIGNPRIEQYHEKHGQ